ncbi:MAG: sugar phosphate isomerase/epimerase [Anaerolineae bacterium]|nr:sugar phosphate isomerase/epimerase [Anaerolineae bacterium]
MKLGLVAPFWEAALGFVAEAGLDCVELHARPGSALDEARREPGGVARIRETLDRYGVRVCGFLFTLNYLAPGEEGERAQAYLREMIDLAAQLEVPTISTTTGRLRDADFRTNLEQYVRVWRPMVRYAAEKGVRIVHENCPHDPCNSPNLALNPVWWNALFEALPAENLGLEYDPSHLVWQGVDYLEAVRATGRKIFSVHAKDCEVDRRRLAQVGYLAEGWWQYRIPGAGEVDWGRLFACLREVGYDGDVCIEHEDPTFGMERMLEALIHAQRYLRAQLGESPTARPGRKEVMSRSREEQGPFGPPVCPEFAARSKEEG